MPDNSYDVAIVGAGPGGYVAAIRAAQLGARVCLVEKSQLGGTCLKRGCIPTKAFVASARAYDLARKGNVFGFHAENVTPDFSAMSARSKATVERLAKGVEYLLRKRKVDVIYGSAKFEDKNLLQVEQESGSVQVEARNFIIATGSKPMVIPALGYDGERVVTSDEMFRLERLPERIVIVGGGVIGCEFASIFDLLGSEVTVVEALPSLLPMVDHEVTRQLGSYFKRRGIKVILGKKVEGVSKGDELTVAVAEGEEIHCDMVLIAIGRRPNSVGLGLENIGVDTNDRGEIVVDDATMATTASGVYAVGDVTSTPWKLAHVASRQGVVAAHRIMGEDVKMSYKAVPSAVFTAPEVACVGLTTQQCQEMGIEFKSAKFSFMGSGKAIAEGETEGFVKLLADSADQRILGVHIIGPQAATLIAEAALAIEHGLRADQLAATIHAHPTLSEALMEAADGIAGLTIHA
ncbi:MAG: dihydrolipoyl dehydrogenase [Firmicutes bacterium]|nr:dihydrolipoyl dehydrogenase [Bacillota bacterium]